jgi:protein TonB
MTLMMKTNNLFTRKKYLSPLIFISLVLSSVDAFAQTAKEVSDSSTSKVFSSVNVVPEFPGGLNSLGQFLAHFMRYPTKAREGNVQGRVIITFVVERDGTLTNFKITRGIGSGCDEEALRVMKLSPKWRPGMQNGKAVRVRYSVPLSFTLSDN